MGATRRLDSYSSDTGWQSLFIVSGIGAAIIMAGIGFQVLQLAYSIWKRKENRDTTGDPWDGRTLEWSTSSPPPVYNFAVTPRVTERDQFWAMKHSKNPAQPQYKDLYLPKNTGMGIYIAGLSFIAGFALIWHIWWLAAVASIGILALIIARTTSEEEHEYVIKASQLRQEQAT
jgi:cytochrome o ubiquinol oxidase subunit I